MDNSSAMCFLYSVYMQRVVLVPNYQNNLLTTGNFFQRLTKKSGVVVKFDPCGAFMINHGNRILIEFRLFSCSNRKLYTILIANVASLACFVMLTF